MFPTHIAFDVGVVKADIVRNQEEREGSGQRLDEALDELSREFVDFRKDGVHLEQSLMSIRKRLLRLPKVSLSHQDCRLSASIVC